MDKEENNKHQIRLERHKWPDEINREKKEKEGYHCDCIGGGYCILARMARK
ncbi:hypothetical protein MGH68_19625 [Erysipelothrix sp. D19-032]